jgi:hypothetical protein
LVYYRHGGEFQGDEISTAIFRRRKRDEKSSDRLIMVIVQANKQEKTDNFSLGIGIA